jgi:hypothetical protein
MKFPDSRLVIGYWLVLMAFIVGATRFHFFGVRHSLAYDSSVARSQGRSVGSYEQSSSSRK